MAAREAALIIDSLGNNWNANSAPTAGTTCTASVAPAAKGRVNLSVLGWSVRNATAAGVTVTLSVRDASIAGTVLASWDMLVATASALTDTFYPQIRGLRGNAISVDFGAPAASVTQKVNIAGWFDSLGDG